MEAVAMATMLQPVVQGTSGMSAFTNGQTSEKQRTELVAEEPDDTPSVDIIINNVVGTYSTKCHLNLKRIAMEGTNVEYHRQHGMLNMRIRRPYTTASIWSSGKITCTGATSEDDSKIAGRKFARKLQNMGYKVKFANFRVVNVLGTCSLPFKINIINFTRAHKEASYEPELHPAVTYRIKEPKATLKIFSTGSITVTAPRVTNIQSAIEYIFPLVSEYSAGLKVQTTTSDIQTLPKFVRKRRQVKRPDPMLYADDDLDSEDYDSMDSEDDFESDESQD